MLDDLLTAFALLLIIEGLLPGLAPSTWLRVMRDAARLKPGTIRTVGVASMLGGAFLLYILT